MADGCYAGDFQSLMHSSHSLPPYSEAVSVKWLSSGVQPRMKPSLHLPIAIAGEQLLNFSHTWLSDA